MTKKTNKLLVFAGLLAIFMGIFGCSSGSSRLERLFIKKCEDGGLSNDTCECIYKEISKKYDMSGWEEFDDDVNKRPFAYMEDVRKATLSCVRKYGP